MKKQNKCIKKKKKKKKGGRKALFVAVEGSWGCSKPYFNGFGRQEGPIYRICRH
jgi:hypothetical protein